jgi:RES domain-containing protein
LIPAFLPEAVSIETLGGNALPKNWRTHAAREALQSMGSEWLRQLRSCVLAVPSSVMPAELNFLINPLHPDFKHVALGDPEMLETDMRLSWTKPLRGVTPPTTR